MGRIVVAILLVLGVSMGARGQSAFQPGGTANPNGSTKVDTSNGTLAMPTITSGTISGATISGGNLGQANGPAQLDSAGTLNANTNGPGQTKSINRTTAAHDADRVNILDYGAKCDGVLNGSNVPTNTGAAGPYYTGTDDTQAIAAALTVALTQNKPLYIPGSYPSASVVAGAATGYCLMMSGNPLGNDGAAKAAITAPITIEGDGKDVSRLVWFADDTNAFVSSIAPNSAGTGYTVGTTVNVLGTDSLPGLTLRVMAVSSDGGVIAFEAVGNAHFCLATVTNGCAKNYPSGPASTSVVSGAGSGLVVNLGQGGSAIATVYDDSGQYSDRLNGVTLRNFSIIGTGHQNPGEGNCNADSIYMESVNNLTIEGMGVDWSRCLSIVDRTAQNVIVSHNRIRWSARDMMNLSSSRTVVTDNILEHGGDDGIAVSSQQNDTGAPTPYREGVVVSGNYLTDVQGIVALGGVGVSITGNTLVRPKNRAIAVSVGYVFTNPPGVDAPTGEGSTPLRAVSITGNTVMDLMNVPTDPIADGSFNRCIQIGTVPPIQATAPAIPGFPASTGEFVSPYPYLGVNGPTMNAPSQTPTPVGIGITISGNTCVRTIPDTGELWSSLPYGPIYGSAGYVGVAATSSTGPGSNLDTDFPVLPSTVFNTQELFFDFGIIDGVTIADNTFSGGAYGVYLADYVASESSPLIGVQLRDATFRGNTFRDMATFGVDFQKSTSLPPSPQQITFENNLFDGDPYFASLNRVITGLASGAQTQPATVTSGSAAIVIGTPSTVLPAGVIVPGMAIQGTGITDTTTIAPCTNNSACGVVQGGAWQPGRYILSNNATASATGTYNLGSPLYTGAWHKLLQGVPVLANDLPGGVEWRYNRVRNWAYLGTFPATDRQVGNAIYGMANSDGLPAGVGGGSFFGSAYPSLVGGWEQVYEDSDPRSSTYGQIIGATNNATQLLISTVETLPPCNATTKGLLQTVSDANAPTYNATLSGLGSVVTMALCNGTNWVAH